jgi:hypothetical protein
MLKVLSVVRPDLSDAADLIEALEAEVKRRDEETPLEVQAARDCERWERARADKAEAEVVALNDEYTRRYKNAEAEVERMKEVAFKAGVAAGMGRVRANAAEAEVVRLREALEAKP